MLCNLSLSLSLSLFFAFRKFRFEYGHEEFGKTVYGYDYIFWDINQSYVFDFMPWITRLGFASSYFKELSDVCLSVR